MKLFFVFITVLMLISCRQKQKEEVYINNEVNIYDNEIEKEIQPGWVRHIIDNGFTPIAIDLPNSYEIVIGKKWNDGFIWSTNIIKFNEKQIGGIFIGNFIPDYLLWGIDDKDLEIIPFSLFSIDNYMKIYNNYDLKPILGKFNFKIKYVFETCFLNFSNVEDEKYLHIWGETNDEDVKDDLLKAFSTIKIIKNSD